MRENFFTRKAPNVSNTESNTEESDISPSVESALNSRIAVIKGPPGTGKTKFILQLVGEQVAKEPQSRILVVSQSRDAIDELLERAMAESKDWITRTIRVGPVERIRPSVQHLSLRKKREEYRLRLEERISQYEGAAGGYLEASALKDLYADLRDDSRLDDLLSFDAQIIAGTCLGVAPHARESHAPFDLCIIDEASKAHAIEALVPMSRAQRWVLVGDRQQLGPYSPVGGGQLPQEFSPDECASLAEKLTTSISVTGLTEMSILDLFSTSQSISTTLRWQRRMVPTIGTLVSDVFYEGQLMNGLVEPHSLIDNLRPPLDKPLVWFDTSDAPAEEDNGGGDSRFNLYEIEVVRGILNGLQEDVRLILGNDVDPKFNPLKVGVISFYGAQVYELQRMVAKDFRRKKSDRPGQLDISVRTVDSAQGAQFDVVILSMVVNNRKGRSRQGRSRIGDIGFLKKDSRINVAISRAKSRLYIVGDIATFDSHSNESVGVKRVLRWVRDCEGDESKGFPPPSIFKSTNFLVGDLGEEG